MPSTKKIHWKGLEELKNSPEYLESSTKEFAQQIPVEEVSTGFELNGNRRDFLKISGFSLAAATLAACNKAPVKKAIPFLNHPEEITPSVPNYYASTYFDGEEYSSVLVKTREGRPIKIEGNKMSGVSAGTTSARIQASVLNLYDLARLRAPMKEGAKVSWESAMNDLGSAISKDPASSVILTGSIISPTMLGLMDKLKEKHAGLKHLSYDSVSYSGLLEAHEEMFGERMIPSYDLSKADVLVGVGCDFLGTWLNPGAFSNAYIKNRKVKDSKSKMSRHYQFEAMLSLTGSNADERVACLPSEEDMVLVGLYNALAAKSGASRLGSSAPSALEAKIKKAANDLWAAKGKALVLAGSNNKHAQLIAAGINNMLGAYGSVLDSSRPMLTKQGVDEDMMTLLSDMKSGKVKTLILANVNPVYTHEKGAEFESAIKEIETTVALCDRIDESAKNCTYQLPMSNWLESWGDAMPVKGSLSLRQPAITPLFKSMQAEEVLMGLCGIEGTYHDYLKAEWKNKMFGMQSEMPTFSSFWRQVLHDGVFNMSDNAEGGTASSAANVSLSEAANALNSSSSEMELILYQKVGIGSGKDANNPWLQEFPDPITRTCWDNYVCLSPNYTEPKGLRTGDIVTVKTDQFEADVPVLVLPGLKAGTAAIALGYGRTEAGKVANGIGVNAYPFLKGRNVYAGSVSISEPKGKMEIAQTQTHHSIEGRDIVKETTLAEFAKQHASGDHEAYNKRPQLVVRGEDNEWTKVHPTEISLFTWQEKKYNGHHWNMSVDLNSCTGCGACVISCQAENNVPVVGKKEVLNRREMHWIRIDRYFSFSSAEGEKVTEEIHYGGENFDNDPDGFDFRYSENLVEDYSDVEVTFQPVMCQQCDNAPCETVCPVVATTHSDEGINQMVYNRCVGTRYCANNCPYKVRRFNWFNYEENFRFEHINPSQEDLGKMVLNPDVTVRARGVMEKCTFCVQRLQAAKLDAKKNQTRVDDNKLETACSQVCPTDAIVFGDINDPDSKIHKMLHPESSEKETRAYGLVEEINTLPSVSYLVKVRNKEA